MKHTKSPYTKPFSSFSPNGPLRPGSNQYKSIASITSNVCATFSIPSQKYTGDQLIGIATMHKSNAVPVTSADLAKAISKMRR